MLKVAICIKQVPVVSMLRFDNELRRIVREGVPSEVNPFDLQAVSACVEIKRTTPVEIVVMTMGPPQARDALLQCLAIGADRGIHLNDTTFAGSDTLATARALSAALSSENFDLICCGLNSVDAETGQVGPEIAEMLGMPQITAVSKIQVHDSGTNVTVTRLNDEGHQRVVCDLPVLLTIAEGIAREVYPSQDEMDIATTKPIVELSAQDVLIDTDKIGVSGSPTWVGEVYATEANRDGIIIRDVPASEAVTRLIDYLETRGVLGSSQTERRLSPLRGPRQIVGLSRSMWVVAEVLGDRIRPVTFELLAEARRLSGSIKCNVEAVLIGGGDDDHVRELTAYGADIVYVAGASDLKHYDTEVYTGVLERAIKTYNPYSVLIPSTINGRDLAGRLAARMELGLTGDCIGFDVDEDFRLVQLKPAFGGSIVAPIFSNTIPNMATVRPGILTPCEPDWSINPVIKELSTDSLGERRIEVLENITNDALNKGALEHARRVVGVGKGIGGPENIALIEPLLGVLSASIGATREVTDAGWLPRQVQIGLSGKAIAPELYIAVAIRGPFNHTVGIRRSDVIVAINDSARSPIFRAADIGILGDYKEIVPALAKAIEHRSKK